MRLNKVSNNFLNSSEDETVPAIEFKSDKKCFSAFKITFIDCKQAKGNPTSFITVQPNELPSVANEPSRFDNKLERFEKIKICSG